MNHLPLRIGFVLALAWAACGLAQQPTEISIGGYRFDPARGIPPEVSRGVPYVEPGPNVAHWRVVQLYRAPDRATQAALKDRFGLELRRFVPGGAYLEYITLQRARELEAAGLARASVPYHPALKYSQSVGTGQFVTEERRAVQGLLLRAALFDTADIRQVEEGVRAIPSARDVRAIDDRRYGGTGQIVFRLEARDALPAVAGIDGIATIEEVGEIVEDNGEAASITQSGNNAATPIWNAGLSGKGQIVHVIESGPPDLDHCFFGTPGKMAANLHPASQAPLPHGTFIAAIVLGDDENLPGTNPRRGAAWNAKLVAGSNQGITQLLSYSQKLDEGAMAGAFIHTNSWHDQRSNPADGPYYTRFSSDKFAWDHEEHLIVGAIANVRPGAALGPPGTAKNALGVSAAKKPDGMNHGQGLTGPFVGRRKPDLAAVGCGVQSAVQDLTDHCKIDVYDNTPGAECSTSDATAQAAAAATLAREYYTNGWYPSGTPQTNDRFIPSGALLKATLLNSTRDMTGVVGYPSNLEGWGVITLNRTLFLPGSARNLRLWDVRNAAPDSLVTNYEPGVINGHEYTLSVANSGEPLKVTLVWTDDAGQFSDALTNDLDLQVLAPEAAAPLLGNNFVGGSSAAGGTADNVNNVEQVLVNNPKPGKWTLRVIATNVAVATQGYALVASAALTQGGAVPNPPTNLRVDP